MRQAVRAIVIKDDQLLVVHRNKFGTEYDTLPGGRVELGEALQYALIRELNEETTIQVDNPRLVFIEHAGQPYGDQHIFLCDYVSGEPRLKEGVDEYTINRLGENLYQPMWIRLNDLPRLPFVSKNLQTKILIALKNGWPDIPEEF